MKTSLIKTGRKYGVLDFIKIPYTVAPWVSAAYAGDKIINALLASANVLVAAQFIDKALGVFKGTATRAEMIAPLVLLIAILSYQNFESQISSFINLKLSHILERTWRVALAEKRARLEYSHIENNDDWDLISRTCDKPVEKFQSGYTYIIEALSVVVQVGGILAIITVEVWWAGLIVIGLSLPLTWISLKAGKKNYDAWQEAHKYTRRANYFEKVLIDRENVEERSLYGYTKSISEKWQEKYNTAANIELKARKRWFIRLKSSSIISAFLSLSIIVTLLFPLSSGQLSIGMFMSLTTSVMSLIQIMSWHTSDIAENLAKNREYLKDLTKMCAMSETSGALDVPNRSIPAFDTIEFRNVSFKYPGTDKYILKNFCLTLKSGIHYAFVGVNGAGKTTITKLLTGLYDNYEGEILLNGRELKQYTQAQLKGIFGVVYQDFARYYITLRDNIALGDVNRRDENDICNAAHTIGLDEAISGLEKGLDNYLGKIYPGSSDLSGGQWQKTAIARAIYNPAQIKILDEPTAALDPVAESEVYNMFGQISKGRSTIFITHRLGAARLADDIVVLDGGRVAEEGNHDNLMALSGIYAEMFDAQRSWYK